VNKTHEMGMMSIIMSQDLPTASGPFILN